MLQELPCEFYLLIPSVYLVLAFLLTRSLIDQLRLVASAVLLETVVGVLAQLEEQAQHQRLVLVPHPASHWQPYWQEREIEGDPMQEQIQLDQIQSHF